MAIKKYHVSKNLFDKASATIGYYVSSSTGDLVQNSPSMASDYIPIEQGQQYYWNDPTARGNAGAFYDSNKTYISGWSTSSTRYVFTAPNGASYVRLTANENNIDNLQLNTGSTALPYEPYYTPYFEEVGYKKYESATDTITSLPADVIADGQSASAVIKGNLSQSGTPTPTSPIYPQETGDKTANKFDYKTAYAQYLSGDDVVITPLQMTAEKQYFTSSEVGTEITISVYAKTVTSNRVYIRASINGANVNSNSISRNNSGLITVTVTPTSTNDFFNLTYGDGGDYNTFNKFMVNTGSTALPYQPYGYKIPILSGGVTTNKYLGEVQTTRNIQQLVLTGQETGWNRSSSSGRNIFYLDTITPDYLRSDDITLVCTHYKAIAGVTGTSSVGEGETALFKSIGTNQRLYFGDSNYSDVTDFTAYLAQQYANGTPVTVWYVLATPTTGILNEPIRKIGTYADSVSVSGIPTTGSAEQFDIDTTLKPSEVQLTYHGWHEHSDTKYTT